eukprot:CAMPEP_0172699100 /NCGR_PEP_ID=MMETSP1074-20121228/29936_1 /TAXON_ID=2916 /ORGANISM="Ceratium fusus, Strain PA161109" /LENGTH=61 /DNA_ID=CAMNT_0013520243 /DNA_START=288 /DNA_END=470 /DNA_ORIENTATION=+
MPTCPVAVPTDGWASKDLDLHPLDSRWSEASLRQDPQVSTVRPEVAQWAPPVAAVWTAPAP